ncbi:Nicotinamide-nucleotide amidohydrolase PncC [Anatilimnocola aggregata]|uniref:Nicotinamide-nucleotide amidohydrolase PncC n=1 Tax=Anatilimnocola aggregata TaxID=2528021 RepID=A0A517YB87_9BACT|nr:nicotinamide-nucleotide amidohydrolase family protein [Anatilimnocola aggregata]QDU27526.1 Nicotinamide-nucleotide amidohydrolase PncC [Anatilimnocola aggregata]
MSIPQVARRVAKLLAEKQRKVAFAESCTGGLVSGALTAVPGISAWHCGGVVTYRNETKQALLKIPASLLTDPGPVSEIVARRMAAGVLAIIPEANISVSVTGHLGPQAPPELDGLVFIGVGQRRAKKTTVSVHELRLPAGTTRLARQKQVVAAALELLGAALTD